MSWAEATAATSARVDERSLAGLSDPVGARLAEIADRLTASCLVEAADGSVISHALGPDEAPDAFASAVLHRDACRLSRLLQDRRSLGVLPGGALVGARLPGWRGTVVSAPVAQAGQRVGWLWLLSRARLDVELVARAAADVAAAVTILADRTSDEPLLAALRGTTVLPPSVRGTANHGWVAAVSCSDDAVPATALRVALASTRAPAAGDVVRVVTDLDAEQTYVVLLTRDGSTAAVRRELQAIAARASEALGAAVQIAVAETGDLVSGLADAREHALAALPHATPGDCVFVPDVRSRVILCWLETALEQLPAVGTDPVSTLLEHDERRGTTYATSLLAWLDAHGEIAAAAESLYVHPNTLRYRLKRAAEVLGADLDDPAVRLEAHLRLRAALRTTTPSRRPSP